jgi:peroxiredoxin
MYKWIFVWFALLIFAPAFSAEEGKPAPELTAKLFDGEQFSLKALSGQVIIVHFWASWCAPCKIEMPVLNAFFKKHQSQGLQILAISMDDKKDEAAARAMMKEYDFKAAFARDARVKAYGRIWRVPLTFVIDKKGILRKDGWVSGHTLSETDLNSTVSPLLR